MTADSPTVALRPMRADEYATFHERSFREYAEEVAQNVGITLEAAQEKATKSFDELLPDELGSPDQHLFVIEADGEAVGELWLGMRDVAGGREAFGYDFWIRPELRDRGLGRAAMRAGADAARELGAIRLALNVFGDNQRAMHLYRSFGFEVTNMNMAMPLE